MKKGLLGGIGLAVVIIAGLICVAKCSVRVPAGYIAVEYKMNGESPRMYLRRDGI